MMAAGVLGCHTNVWQEKYASEVAAVSALIKAGYGIDCLLIRCVTPDRKKVLGRGLGRRVGQSHGRACVGDGRGDGGGGAPRPAQNWVSSCKYCTSVYLWIMLAAMQATAAPECPIWLLSRLCDAALSMIQLGCKRYVPCHVLACVVLCCAVIFLSYMLVWSVAAGTRVLIGPTPQPVGATGPGTQQGRVTLLMTASHSTPWR